ncbi:MAG: HDIG domain-containing protein, partial [Candidatus Aminicenantes bacterium]|nr:HDIG domain-containing protein [Candidatus Aminicenantes bacterium]
AAKSARQPPPKEEKAGFPRNVLRNPFVLIAASAVVLASVLSYLPSKTLSELKPGDIATEDLVAPADLTIEDTETTDQRRREAAASILPVYNLNPNVMLNSADRVRQFFAFGREWMNNRTPRDPVALRGALLEQYGLDLGLETLRSLEREEFAPELEESLLSLLEKISASGVLLSKSLFVNREAERGLNLVRPDSLERTIKAEEILEIKEAKSRLTADINALDLSARRKGLLISLSHAFLSPNVAFDRVETEIRRTNAWSAVETVFYTIKKGRVIIRKGDEAGETTVRFIAAVNRAIQDQGAWLRSFIGSLLLFALLLVTLWYYLRSLLAQATAVKYFRMMMLTIFVSLLLYKLVFFLAATTSLHTRVFLFSNAGAYKFLLPLQCGAILFAFLTTNAVALIFVVLNSLLAGFLAEADFFLLLFGLIGGMAAIYGIKYYGRGKRTNALRAGFYIATPINMFLVITIHLVQPRSAGLEVLAAETVMAVLGGLAGAALAFILLPIYESLFRFVTQSKLFELTNSESEILRQFAIDAPGSYHHSLIVSAMAEKAAEKINLDALLVKAGALYHDIGKIKMPEYFIENKERKHDAHKDLAPSMSTLVIINHVKEGVEIARKLRLPERIKEIIEQHHGNSVVRYFYQKAKEKSDPEIHTVGEESFRYPGPPPQTKEAALVMLADSVEAASRSLRVHKDEHLARVIRDIFDNYLEDGQLDDCAFSLREIRTIAQSFLATLHTIYQPRVEYPGFDFESRKGPEKNGEPASRTPHGRDHQPPEEEPHQD